MDDKAFNELKLRASIIPTQPGWPAPEYSHWIALHRGADEARERVRKAYAQMDDIDRNADLSREGKARQKQRLAAKAVAELEASSAITRARDAVARAMKQWEAKIGQTIKHAANEAEAVLHAQIRDRIVSMKEGRMSFLEKHAGDPVIAAAILEAPAFLSGLDAAELAMVKHKVEQHVSPDIIEAKAKTAKALQELEHGWQRARDVIGKQAGLQKGPDGSWGRPADVNAAA